MAKTIETMGAMWPKNVTGTLWGFDKALGGTFAPSGFDGNEVIEITGDTVDDSVTLVLDEVNLGITTIEFSANYVGQANVAVALTTSDSITFTGTSANMLILLQLAAATNNSVNTYIKTADTTADTGHFHTMEHGAAAVPPVHEEGGLVRVGHQPRDPVSYPNHQDGWDSADLSGDKYPVLPGQPT